MDLLFAHWELLLFFFGVALLYATVGFGGGSSYLAIMAAYEINFLLLRPIALLCNLTVVSGGTWLHYRNGHLKLRKTLPLVALSVPFAFLGGRISIGEEAFFIVLGCVLALAGIFTIFQPSPQEGEDRGSLWWVNALLGGAIGFLSGLVGIGGGIFLAPALHLLKWDSPKTIAATASFFILVNSLAGIAGQFSRDGFAMDWGLAGGLIVAVLLGGQVGSRLGTKVLPNRLVKLGTAVLVLFVAGRILLKYL